MMSRPRRVYDTAEWRRVRLVVLARDMHACTVRLPTGQVCRRPANCVDHIVPISEGGPPFDQANLRAACRSCNTRLRNARRAALARGLLGEPHHTPRSQPRRRPVPTTAVTTLQW